MLVGSNDPYLFPNPSIIIDLVPFPLQDGPGLNDLTYSVTPYTMLSVPRTWSYRITPRVQKAQNYKPNKLLPLMIFYVLWSFLKQSFS